MTDHSIVRDRWGRPLVTTDGQPLKYEKGRKTPINAVGYTRVSTLAGALDDSSGLIDWAAAQAAIGTVRSPGISASIASLVSAHKDPWNVPEAKRQLKPLVARARQAAGSDEAADLGTGFHGITELIDRGQEPEFIPEQFKPWIDKYREALADWEVLDCEPFLVVDEIQAAGSMDRLLRHKESGQVVAADLKSGKSDPFYPLKVTVQVAIYAHGVRYDQATGKREPLHPDIDLSQGLLIHAPIRGGRPRCTLYPLDLGLGWELAKLSVRVREARRLPKLEVLA